MYTLSSPTVLATDAAVHPAAVQVLHGLSAAFRISQDGAFALAEAWHDRDRTAHSVAWTLLALLDMNAPTLPQTLRAAGRTLEAGASVNADELAQGRFGTSSQVGALVAKEAAVWPDAPIAPVPGAGTVPASAAAAAAAVAALWASPDLGDDQVEALRAPFERAGQRTGLLETGEFTYGPRTAAVQELIDHVQSGKVTPEQLSGISWPTGVWAKAMHEGAWACLREGLLRAQMRSVLDVTLGFVLANPDLGTAGTRACMPALHALTVARLAGPAMDEKSLGELALAELAL